MTTMATRLPKRAAGTTEALRRAVRPSKYRNQPVMIDGIRFASKAEGKRYQELRILEMTGHITALSLQVPYKLTAYGEPICKYVADFVYLNMDIPVEGRRMTVEDVKGVETDAFRLKAKLFEAQYGYPITIIKA